MYKKYIYARCGPPQGQYISRFESFGTILCHCVWLPALAAGLPDGSRKRNLVVRNVDSRRQPNDTASQARRRESSASCGNALPLWGIRSLTQFASLLVLRLEGFLLSLLGCYSKSPDVPTANVFKKTDGNTQNKKLAVFREQI
jgi:hypothetical protein